jgi:hypothetical protein
MSTARGQRSPANSRSEPVGRRPASDRSNTAVLPRRICNDFGRLRAARRPSPDLSFGGGGPLQEHSERTRRVLRSCQARNSKHGDCSREPKKSPGRAGLFRFGRFIASAFATTGAFAARLTARTTAAIPRVRGALVRSGAFDAWLRSALFGLRERAFGARLCTLLGR